MTTRRSAFRCRFLAGLPALGLTVWCLAPEALWLRRMDASPRASALRPTAEGARVGLEEALAPRAAGAEELEAPTPEAQRVEPMSLALDRAA